MNKIYNLWMEAVENYCLADLAHDAGYSLYYLGKVHAYFDVIGCKQTLFDFWGIIFNSSNGRNHNEKG